MMNKTLLLVALVAATMLSTAAISMTSDADAKITAVCRNGQGHENSGCNDNNQPPQDEQNENPAGHAPPGQN